MSSYFGTDGNSALTLCSGTGLGVFYIGKLGENLTICSSTSCGTSGYQNAWNDTTASDVLNASGAVYGYWALHGPADKPSTYSTYPAYGAAQADQAITALQNRTTAGQMNRLTIFADVEQPDNLGWLSTNTGNTTTNASNAADNQDVINGFLDAIWNMYATVGVYSSPCAWSGITGAVSWVPNDSPVAWTNELSYALQYIPTCAALEAGWGYYYNDICNATDDNAQGFASIVPTIWQYTQANGDLDVASALPR